MKRFRSTLAVLALAPTALSAAPRLLTPEDVHALLDVGDPAISPDGVWAAYELERDDTAKDERTSDLWMVPLAGGEALRLTSSPKSDTRPRFSPDGRFLAFLGTREGKKDQVQLLDRRGGEAVQLTDYKAEVSDLAWSPDGSRLALIVADVDPDDPDLLPARDDGEKPKPKPIVITRRQFKRDGEGFLRELRTHLYVFDVKTRTSTQVTSGPYDDSEPAWSPDGRLIAFVSNRSADPDANQDADVFVVAPQAGAEPRRLGASPGSDAAPAFSPDGRLVAFARGGDPKDLWYGPTSVAVAPVAGGPERVLTAELDRNATRPRFTPDGKAVLFLLEDGGNSHLARVELAGGRVTRVVDGERDVQGFDVGPKGELVVRESQPHQPFELSRVAPGRLVRLTRANDAWLADVRLAPTTRHEARSADGTSVDFFLTVPPDARPGERLPTVLRIHGGPASQYSTQFELGWQLLAAHGYAVVAANPRGSTGYGLAYSRAIWADWGNKDYEDVMAAVDAAVARGVADPERLGVGGWSYGGILTNYVITKTKRFKAAISGASEANYLANYGHDHYQYEWEAELGLPWRNVERWVRLSPWFQVEQVTTPTLILCGQEDWNVPLLNSEQLFLALRRLGVPTELVIYPGEDHDIDTPSYKRDRYARYLAWYDRYLKR